MQHHLPVIPSLVKPNHLYHGSQNDCQNSARNVLSNFDEVPTDMAQFIHLLSKTPLSGAAHNHWQSKEIRSNAFHQHIYSSYHDGLSRTIRFHQPLTGLLYQPFPSSNEPTFLSAYFTGIIIASIVTSSFSTLHLKFLLHTLFLFNRTTSWSPSAVSSTFLSVAISTLSEF